MSDDSVDRMIKLYSDIREATEEAHKAIRDLRTEKKDLARVRKEFIDSSDLVNRLDKSVADGIAEFQRQLSESIEKATQKVYDRFDQITMICLGEDPVSVRDGKRTVLELVRDFVKAKELPVTFTEKVHLEMSCITFERQRSTPALSVGFSKLPIITNERIPPDIVLLVLPEVSDAPRVIVEVNTRTGAGVEEASAELLTFGKLRYRAMKEEFERIPDAYKKPKEGAEPA